MRILKMTRGRLTVGILALGLNGAFAAPPQRVVSMSPSVTEMLYGLGAFGQVVAVSDYCTYPPAVKSLPRIGGWQTPNLEKLATLRPSLVILTDSQAPFHQDHIEQLGIRVLVTPSQTIHDVFAAMEAIGEATGREREARRLAAATRAVLERVRGRARNLPRPSVLCIVGRTPGTLNDLYAVTRGSFLAELIEIAGGRVVASPSKTGYGKISQEVVLTMNPEIVIDLVHGARGAFAEDPLAAWRDLPELKAVRQGRVHAVRADSVPHASQRITETILLLARILHPEVPAGQWGAK